MSIWEKVGTILWSIRTKPWESTYFPWQIGGGEVETSYDSISDITTNYDTISKPTTIYNDINKPEL